MGIVTTHITKLNNAPPTVGSISIEKWTVKGGRVGRKMAKKAKKRFSHGTFMKSALNCSKTGPYMQLFIPRRMAQTPDLCDPTLPRYGVPKSTVSLKNEPKLYKKVNFLKLNFNHLYVIRQCRK